VSLKVSILDPQIVELEFFVPNFYGARRNTAIEDKIFQHIPRRVAKFRENRPRDVKQSVVDNKKIT